MTQHIIDTDELEKLVFRNVNHAEIVSAIDLRALIANSPQADGMVLDVINQCAKIAEKYEPEEKLDYIDYASKEIRKLLSAYKPQADDVLEQAAQAIDALASSGENKDDWTITRDLAFHRASEEVRALIVKPQAECKINPFSSRMCELGTKACIVQHKPQVDDVRKNAWLPIETAPKDGSSFDVWLGNCDESDRQFYCTGDTRRSPDWHYKDGKFRPHISLGVMPTFVIPTHWMPLPSPPLDKARE